MKSLRKFRKSPITIELVGGLGNQLFGYFAGVFIAHSLGVELRPFIRSRAKGEARHQSSINSFDLPHTIYGHRSLLPNLERLLRLGGAFVQRLPILGMLVKNGGESLHRSIALGKDHSLGLIRPGSYVVGYFQTHEYYNSLRQSGVSSEVRLRSPSLWFNEQRLEVEETKPLIVHVRRGDYLHSKNNGIGALSVEYFRESLLLVKSLGNFENSKTWVFSDDVSQVKADFEDAGLDIDRWIEPPANSDPAESIILMSLGAAIVISNSTFSWWAAALGKPEVVVAPSPWFRSMPEPEGLIPADWLRVESTWKK